MRLTFAALVLALGAAGPGCAVDGGKSMLLPSPDGGAATCDLPHVPAAHCAAAHELLLPAALAPARGNKYGDNEAAATLGFKLFFNPDLGKGIGCPTCHMPEFAFTDRVPVSKGQGPGNRNAPTTFNTARLSVIFWDGRGDSLWSQPLFAIENPVEMNSSRLELAHLVASNQMFRPGYEQVFGPLPAVESWPAAGKPGDPAFDGLSAEVKDQVNRLAANVGKALEAYMRKNVTGTAALDDFLRGDHSRLVEPAQRGLGIFLERKCHQCHGGPMLTDEKLHKVGFPSLPGAPADRGGADALPTLSGNVFNLAGPYADPGPGIPGTVARPPAEEGSFRTPSLRNIARTFPYGHDGALASLADVLDVHAPGLTADQRLDLLVFFDTLDGEYPLPPWSEWPTRQ